MPSIAGAGDSVVATVDLGFPGCDEYRADAGLHHGTLVMTISDSVTNRYCEDLVGGPAYARIIVHGVPRGAYRAVVDLRVVPTSGASRTRTLLQRNVALP